MSGTSLVSVIFSELLREASKPQQSPAPACMKLCGLVNVCTKSTHEGLRQWAFSYDTSLALFTYYIEWKQPLQTGSMKLVLDVLVTTSAQTQDPEIGARITTAILDTVVTTVSRQSRKSAVKASIQSLVHFLSKHAVSLGGVKDTYRRVHPSVSELPDLELWGSFAADVSSWMSHREVCPIAGKLLLHLLQGLQGQSSGPSQPTTPGFSVATWLGWVQDAVVANPDILETVKNHVFYPLFKVDKPSALQVLADFNRRDPVQSTDGELDCLTLLQLAGLEVGKKVGLVEEPGEAAFPSPINPFSNIDHVLRDDQLYHAAQDRCDCYPTAGLRGLPHSPIPSSSFKRPRSSSSLPVYHEADLSGDIRPLSEAPRNLPFRR